MKFNQFSIGNYRCFSSNAQGFGSWGGVNLIIGRNNSGKSRLLDLIRYCCDKNSVQLHSPSFIRVGAVLEEADLSQNFQPNASGGDIPENHWSFAKRYIGSQFNFNVLGNSVDSIEIAGHPPTHGKARFEQVALRAGLPLQGKTYINIAAERSIQPEVESQDWMGPNGVGATAVIQRYLMDSNLPSALIEVDLLRELNRIFEPDNEFSRILVQRHLDDKWEVYLEEDGKGRIPLSASGSGLQTVILILLALHVVPDGAKKKKSDLVVSIEEPENNLHPALQRRLLTYLQDYSKTNDSTFFITTHSTVAIDQFVGQKDARLFHVRHDGEFAKVSAVEAYADGHEILRDLDVRASDLLQSNGIIWVEGPTDRLYINKWIEIASAGRLREGAHYQCVFYGGKLLSHLSADGDLSLRKELIDLITINKNAAIVIDSDRRKEKGRLNSTKTRIKVEFEGIGSMVWVTKGREIENYVHPAILAGVFADVNSVMPQRLESVMDWVLSNAKRKKIAPDKITLASKIIDRTLDVSSLSVLDLEEQLSGLVAMIEKWNNL
jgi:energy-coupling factor transporter ATP-binding protein EcfA2